MEWAPSHSDRVRRPSDRVRGSRARARVGRQGLYMEWARPGGPALLFKSARPSLALAAIARAAFLIKLIHVCRALCAIPGYSYIRDLFTAIRNRLKLSPFVLNQSMGGVK
jgi:hypothetical protein